VLVANLNARAQHKQMGMAGQYSDSSRPTHQEGSYSLSQFRATDATRMRHHDMDLETGVVHIRTEIIADDDYQVSKELA